MQLIGPYELSDRIAEGPMSDVYMAQNIKTLKWVAYKLGKISPTDSNYDVALQRFQREGLLLREVRHPALPTYLDSGLTPEGNPYLALEWIEGPTLTQVLGRQTRLPAARAVAIARQIASALAVIHAKGYIHSDIKPDNIILMDHSDPFSRDLVKFMDFGVAGTLEADTGLTRSGFLIGTPYYMAPEQIRASALSPATDIWQLGILLFQMLTGTLPFEGKDTYTVLASRVTAQPKFPEDLSLPPAITAFILSTLEKDPTLRPANGEEAEKLLAAIQSTLPPYIPTPAPKRPHAPTNKLNRVRTPVPHTEPGPAPAPPAPAPSAPLPITAAPSSPAISSPEEAASPAHRATSIVAAVTALIAIALGIAFFTLRRTNSALPGPTPANNSILASAPWLGVLFGIALALLGIALGRTVRKLLAGREHHLAAHVQSALSETRDQSHLSQTLAIQVDELVAKCRLVDEKILGMTMAVMVTEYSTATAFDDRQKALMNAVTLLDKLMPKLSPWYVRHDKLVALAVTLTGILSGLAAVAENVVKLVHNK